MTMPLDAYQRAFEIYLRRLRHGSIPATEGAWLRVVVKHEAMAIRTARLESVDRDDVDLDHERPRRSCARSTTRSPSGERVDRSVEALRALKPDEARAVAEGRGALLTRRSARHFGWSYTKVNRSITEGRKRFLAVFKGIEAGEACEAYEPALSAWRTARRRVRRSSRSGRTCATAPPVAPPYARCAARVRAGWRSCCRSAGSRGCWRAT